MVHQGSEIFGWKVGVIAKPEGTLLRIQDQRHAAMRRPDHRISRRGDQRAGHAGLRMVVENPGEHHGLAVRGTETKLLPLTIGQHLPLFGMAHKEFTERFRHSENVDKPPADIRLGRYGGDDSTVQLRRARLQEAREQEQCLIGISGVREIGEKVRFTAGSEHRFDSGARQQPTCEIEIGEAGSGQLTD